MVRVYIKQKYIRRWCVNTLPVESRSRFRERIKLSEIERVPK